LTNRKEGRKKNNVKDLGACQTKKREQENKKTDKKKNQPPLKHDLLNPLQ